MKKKLLTAALLIVAPFVMKAQEKIRVMAGEDFSKALNSYGIYRFPAFTQSKIFFRNRTPSAARLNYNLVLAELQFINSPTDTLSIGNPEDLQLIEIDSVLYYYDKRYLEVLAGGADDIKLAFWQQIKIEFEQLGAFDKPANGVDVKSYKNVNSPMGYNITDLTANQNRIITKETRYFLVDKYGKSFPANKSSFYNLFPGGKSKIQDYIKQADIHFERIEDLKKLYAFCREVN
jgi:hypothetical protein